LAPTYLRLRYGLLLENFTFFLPINISLDIVAGASWRMSRVYNSTGVIIFGQELLLLLGRCVY
jgi:hypothetical protein